MKLEDTMERATLGPLELHDMERATIVTVKKDPSCTIANCNSNALDDRTNHINAALLAHAYNVLGPLVQALKKIAGNRCAGSYGSCGAADSSVFMAEEALELANEVPGI